MKAIQFKINITLPHLPKKYYGLVNNHYISTNKLTEIKIGNGIFKAILNKREKDRIRDTSIRLELGVDEIRNKIPYFIFPGFPFIITIK